MKNCLVTKLKGTVDNPGLLKIDEALFETKQMVARNLFGTSGTVTATIVSGNNTFLDGSVSKVITSSTTDNDVTFTDSSAITKIKINSKFDLGYFWINKGYVNFDDFKYSRIKEFVCTSSTLDGSVSIKNITDSFILNPATLIKEHTIAEIIGEGSSSLFNIYIQDLANIRHIANELNEFAKCSNLQRLAYTYTGPNDLQLQGSLESFVAANRTLGRTTGEISCLFGTNAAITFNGGTAATETRALLQWTATTITWNGVTINA